MLFRPDANAGRMADGAERLSMVPPPQELFLEAVKKVGWRGVNGVSSMAGRPSSCRL